MIKTIFGNKRHYKNGLLHRDNGPAVECSNGTKCWYQNGKRHRIDGPAIEHSNEDKSWWINGKLHRDNGPAIEWIDGSKEYWYNGKKIECNFTEEFLKIINSSIQENLNNYPCKSCGTGLNQGETPCWKCGIDNPTR